MTSTSNQLRQAFLDYFAKNGHEVVPSSSLIPGNDPTLLFTNAGMVQFKDVFLGREKRAIPRAASAQRCVRAGGKHNDLENVGYTARHHTFFEMLGNFSFGDYFKRDAIRFAWEFITKDLGLPPERLWCTVYEDDDEAASIWLDEIGVDKSRFARLGMADNFWAMGDTGPCGPCSEIFYDHGPEVAGGPPGSPNSGGDRYIEIWNLVFMQFERSADGTLTPLPKPSVDTGMGLERLAAVMQGVHSNYEIDLFVNLIRAAAALTRTSDLGDKSLRVIADHIRACSFLIADGVVPGNEGRGYVLRRIIRRAIRHGYKLGVEEPFFYKLVKDVEKEMGGAYPVLGKQRSHVESVLRQEEQRFAETLSQGMRLLDDAHRQAQGRRHAARRNDLQALRHLRLPRGPHGRHRARARAIEVDRAGFEREMDAQRAARPQGEPVHDGRRAASRRSSERPSSAATRRWPMPRPSSRCSTRTASPSTRSKQGQRRHRRARAHAVLRRERRPGRRHRRARRRRRALRGRGHAEARARVRPHRHGRGRRDRGRRPARGARRRAAARGDRREPFGHAPVARRAAQSARRARAAEGLARRARSAALRLLALRAREPEQLREIEALVNEQIRLNADADIRVLAYDEAIAAGALAFFGDKYGDRVRVLKLGDFSTELCGGTHVSRAGDIGLFKIIGESGIAAGVRRIEAVSGRGALEWVNANEDKLRDVAALVKAGRDDVAAKVAQLVERARCARARAAEPAAQARDGRQPRSARRDAARERRQSARGANRRRGREVAARHGRSAQGPARLGHRRARRGRGRQGRLVATITKDLTARFKAGDLIKPVAELVGGRGGGRADFAQAGGSRPDKVDDALALVPGIVARPPRPADLRVRSNAGDAAKTGNFAEKCITIVSGRGLPTTQSASLGGNRPKR